MGKFQLISSANADSGSRASSFSFTNIPNTYTDLMIYASLRSTQGANTVSGIIYINNGTSNNYSIYELASSSNTVTAQNFTFTSGAFNIPANNSQSSTFSPTWIYLPNYAYTFQTKQWLEDSGAPLSNSTSATTYMGVATQNTTTTISQIDIYVTAGNLAQYSSVYLYGIEMTP